MSFNKASAKGAALGLGQSQTGMSTDWEKDCKEGLGGSGG